MNVEDILEKAILRQSLTREEAYFLYDNASLHELTSVADAIRHMTVADPEVVTWQIDRNVNITNVCKSGCKFCNFPR